VATISRLLWIIGLFTEYRSLLWGSFAKETYNFMEPTTRSHPIHLHILRYILQKHRALRLECRVLWEYRAPLLEYRALLWEYRALLRRFKAHLWKYRALLQRFTALLWEYRALLWRYRAFLWEYRALLRRYRAFLTHVLVL